MPGGHLPESTLQKSGHRHCLFCRVDWMAPPYECWVCGRPGDPGMLHAYNGGIGWTNPHEVKHDEEETD